MNSICKWNLLIVVYFHLLDLKHLPNHASSLKPMKYTAYRVDAKNKGTEKLRWEHCFWSKMNCKSNLYILVLLCVWRVESQRHHDGCDVDNGAMAVAIAALSCDDWRAANSSERWWVMLVLFWCIGVGCGLSYSVGIGLALSNEGNEGTKPRASKMKVTSPELMQTMSGTMAAVNIKEQGRAVWYRRWYNELMLPR